jgi:hypothetical protein
MAREGKPEQSYRHVIEQWTERLLARGDVARYDVAGAEYFHRPGELLVRRDMLDRLRQDLARFPVEQTGEDEALGVATFQLSKESPVHDVSLELRKVAGDPTAAGPHHVLFGAPKWGACPGRPPFPAAPVSLDARGGSGEGVVIAVIDTGQAEQSLQLDWMRDHVVVGQDDIDPLNVDDEPDYLDFEAGHGTFIAGIVGQVAPGAKVLARKAIDTSGVTDDLTVARAIRGAIDDGAHVINLSLGGYSLGDVPPVALSGLLGGKEQRQDGPVFVAAAGNDGLDRPFYPAAFPSVIAVAALGSRHRRAGFSNFGPWVDAAADGERLLSTFVHGTVLTDSDGNGHRDEFAEPWAYWSGTSFAAPQVAAAIAVRMADAGETAQQAAFAVVRDPALARSAGLGVPVQTGVRSHPARVGLP